LRGRQPPRLPTAKSSRQIGWASHIHPKRSAQHLPALRPLFVAACAQQLLADYFPSSVVRTRSRPPLDPLYYLQRAPSFCVTSNPKPPTTAWPWQSYPLKNPLHLDPAGRAAHSLVRRNSGHSAPCARLQSRTVPVRPLRPELLVPRRPQPFSLPSIPRSLSRPRPNRPPARAPRPTFTPSLVFDFEPQQ